MKRLFAAADLILLFLSFGAVLYAIYFVFLVVPDERTMGAIQRIFYFHVGSAIACYVAVAGVLASSVLYLATRRSIYDRLLVASGEVGFVFCTIVLVSGMIWGHTAWNVWFRFEPRLVTFLLLWFIFLSFVLLRVFGEPGKVSAHSAILGIVGAVTVPLMVYSIKLLPAAAQLHPQVLEHRGLKDPLFGRCLFISTLALCLFCLYLVRLRLRVERLGRLADRGQP